VLKKINGAKAQHHGQFFRWLKPTEIFLYAVAKKTNTRQIQMALKRNITGNFSDG